MSLSHHSQTEELEGELKQQVTAVEAGFDADRAKMQGTLKEARRRRRCCAAFFAETVASAFGFVSPPLPLLFSSHCFFSSQD